jgi:hypothetical protein
MNIERALLRIALVIEHLRDRAVLALDVEDVLDRPAQVPPVVQIADGHRLAARA